MPRGPLTEAHKAAMKAGRERALAASTGKKPRKAKAPPAEPVWTFNVDDKGALAIIDENGEGIEVKPDDAVRLSAFLARALPRQLADMTLREAARESPMPDQLRTALGLK